MSDLVEYAKTVAGGLTARWFAAKRIKQVAARKLVEFAQDLSRQADMLSEMDHRLQTQDAEFDRLNDKLRAARSIEGRIDKALSEMKQGAKAPAPAAIILSPAQYRDFDSWQRRKTYRELPILIASGLTGPIIASRDGLDGLTRQAPELAIRKA